MSAHALLVATRKGLWILRPDAARQRVDLDGPHFLGHVLHHAVLDPRDRRTLLVAARTGHLGPTVFRSVDLGKSWTEATAPPAFPKAKEGEQGRVVDHVFWLEPGHASEPDCWYAGTSPEGLFRTEDGGVTWASVTGFNDHPRNRRVDRARRIRHARRADPALDPDRPARSAPSLHRDVGLGRRRLREPRRRQRLDADQQGLRDRLLARFRDPEFGHDPHCVRLHPLEPDLLYQQNHCGIYRMRPARERVGADRRQHAEGDRRHRLPDRAAPARSRRPRGCSRWTAPTCGRAPVPAAGPPPT